MRLSSVIFAGVFVAALGGVAKAQVLKKEPAMGKLQPGQTVLVDDGWCPKGQVKKVIGGNHVKVGGKQQVERARQCVPK
jgi:hypothetical protein